MSTIVIGMHELVRLRQRFEKVEDLLTKDDELASRIGQQQVESARYRILDTKVDPKGVRWQAWSERYRKAGRKKNTSLMVRTGAMADSMDYNVINPGAVEVGSPLPYFGAHLYGVPSRNLPQRAALDTEPGFADSSDRREIREILRDIWNREVKKR